MVYCICAGNAVVERFDLRPQLAHLEHLARRGVGARHARRGRPGLLLGADHEGRAHPVHEAVGGRGGDDFAAQPMPADGAREAAAHGLREISLQLLRQIRVLRHIRLHQVMAEPDLAVGQQHRQFRPRQALRLFVTFGQCFVIRQELDAAIQIAAALQLPDQMLMLGQPRHGLHFQGAQGLALQVVVAQYQRRHIAGHARQQLVAILQAQPAGEHQRIEQDLQIHFDIRGVDAGGVVDEVGVQPPALAGRIRSGPAATVPGCRLRPRLSRAARRR